MRKVVLNANDYDLFNTDIDPIELDFLVKHRDAFRRMWHEQGREFWIKFIVTFQSFAAKYGFIKEVAKKETITGCFDQAFIYLHEQFVDGKFKDAKELFDDVVIMAQNKNLIVNLHSKSFAKDPFYKKETRDTFRKLFGQPNEKESVIKVYLLLPMYTKFGGAVVKCLRRWLEADDIPPSEQKGWLSLMDIITPEAKTTVPESITRLGSKCEYCDEIIKDEVESHTPGPWEPDWIIYMKETESGRCCGPCWTYGWPPHEDPRFHDKRNPLFKIKADPWTDWRDKLTFNKYSKFAEYVREVYVPRMPVIPYKPEVEVVNTMVLKFLQGGGTEKAMRDRMHGMMSAAQNGNLATTMQQWFGVGPDHINVNKAATTISECAAVAKTLPEVTDSPPPPEPKKSKKKSKKASSTENKHSASTNEVSSQATNLSIADFARAAKLTGELAENEDKKKPDEGATGLDWSKLDLEEGEKLEGIIHVIKLGKPEESPPEVIEEDEKPTKEYKIKEYDWQRELLQSEGIMNVKICLRGHESTTVIRSWNLVRYYSSKHKRWQETATNDNHGDYYPHSLDDYPHVPRSDTYIGDSSLILDLILQHPSQDDGKCDCSTCRAWLANTEDEKFKALLTEVLFGEELSPLQELGLQDPDKKTQMKDRLRRKQIEKFLESEREKICGGMVNVPSDTQKMFEQIWDEFKIKADKSTTQLVWPYNKEGPDNGKKDFMKRVMELHVRRKIFEEEILGLHPRIASDHGGRSPAKKRDKRERKTSTSPTGTNSQNHSTDTETKTKFSSKNLVTITETSKTTSTDSKASAAVGKISTIGNITIVNLSSGKPEVITDAEIGSAAAGGAPTLLPPISAKLSEALEEKSQIRTKWGDGSVDGLKRLLSSVPAMRESFGNSSRAEVRAELEWLEDMREKAKTLDDSEEDWRAFLQVSESYPPTQVKKDVAAEMEARNAMVSARKKSESKVQGSAVQKPEKETKVTVNVKVEKQSVTNSGNKADTALGVKSKSEKQPVVNGNVKSEKPPTANLGNSKSEKKSNVSGNSKSEKPSNLGGNSKSDKTPRACANSQCNKVEPKFRTYQKCLRCREQKIRPAAYYCGKDCQVVDWKTKHKQFHREQSSEVADV